MPDRSTPVEARVAEKAGYPNGSDPETETAIAESFKA